MSSDVAVQYRTLKMPDELMQRVDHFVASNHDGFVSVPEVVKQAIRDFLAQRSEFTE